MKQLIKQHLTDCSNRDSFRFSLVCSECGAVWESSATRFSKAGANALPETKQVIAQALYQREWALALDHAAEEALQVFNLCPLCKRLVCDRCFLVCDDLDMCRSCTNYLQEQGEPVMEGPLESFTFTKCADF